MTTIFLLFFFGHAMQLVKFICLTRDWIPAPSSESRFLTTGSPGNSPPPWAFGLYFLILMNHLCIYHCWLLSGVKMHLLELVQQTPKLPPIPASALPWHLGILKTSCFLLIFFFTSGFHIPLFGQSPPAPVSTVLQFPPCPSLPCCFH